MLKQLRKKNKREVRLSIISTCHVRSTRYSHVYRTKRNALHILIRKGITRAIYVYHERVVPCPYCGQKIEYVSEMPRTVQKVMPHKHHHESIEVVKVPALLKECFRDDFEDAIFCIHKTNALTRDVYNAWMWYFFGSV